MVVTIPYELVSHTRKICSLYKRWLRNIETWYPLRHEYRYRAVQARGIFEEILNEKDMMKSKRMIEEREEELYNNIHPLLPNFPTSPGGTAYEREPIIPDRIVDHWHPLEKAAYPKYFQKREMRKQQYIDMWERKYGNLQSELEKCKKGQK